MILILLSILLFCVGLYGVFMKHNLIKIVIGFVIIEYAINCIFVLIGYIERGAAPIIEGGKMMKTVDPLPQALVLTAIVIGLGTTALLVSLAVRLYQRFGTFDIRKIRNLRG